MNKKKKKSTKKARSIHNKEGVGHEIVESFGA